MASETPSKKARLEFVEPFEDEFLDFTDDQWEKIDLLSSQAITNDKRNEPTASTPRARTPAAAQNKVCGSSGNGRGQSSGAGDSISSKRNSFSSNLFAPNEPQKKLYQKPTVVPHPKANVVNTYNPYTSVNNASRVCKQSTTVPSLFTASGTQSNDATCKGVLQRQTDSGVRRSGEQSTNLVRHPSTGAIASVKNEVKCVDTNNILVKKLQEELTKHKDEVKKLTQEQDVKVGEAKYLRESLKRVEVELDQERQERMKLLDKERVKHETDLSELKGELSTANTELAFMKQELLNKQTKCQQLEMKMKRLRDCAASTSSNALTPSQKKVTPPRRNKFLEGFSFNKSGPLNPTTSFAHASVQVDAGCIAAQRRRTQLRTKLHQGLVPSATVMSHLLQADAIGPSDPLGGILSLLQVQSAKDFLLQNGAEKKMSPSLSERTQSVHSKKQRWPSLTTGMLTNLPNQTLAVQGLESLLRNGSQDESVTDSAAALIPFIEDRILSYRDVLRFFADSQGLGSVTSSLSSYKTSSLESYFSSVSLSPTSSLSNIQLTPAMLSQMEDMVIVALVVLHKLISLRPHLMQLIVAKPKLYSSDTESKVKDEARSSTLVSNSDISPVRPCIDFVEHVVATTQIAALVEELTNPRVIAAFLEVLLEMTKIGGVHMASRVKVLFSSVIFKNFFRAHCGERAVLLYLRLAQETACYYTESASWLCGHTRDTCFVTQLSTLCQDVHTVFTSNVSSRITMQVFRFLATMVATYQQSAPLAQDSDTCGNCSRELLLSLICMFNKEIAQYRNLTTSQIHLVQAGIHLLHQISGVDGHFVERRGHAEKQYVTLVCKIGKLMSHAKEKFLPTEGTIIQELKDFESDDDDMDNNQENEADMDIGPG